MLNRIVSFLFVFLFVMLPVHVANAQSDESPQYATDETRTVIEKMINAHGGMAKWKNASSISYDFIMYLPSIPLSDGMSLWDIWVTKKTTIQPKSKRAYTDLLWEGPAQIASDAKKIWTVDYKSQMPPVFRLWHHASFINMPWMIFDKRVHLGAVEKAKLPNEETEYIKIRMTAKRNGTVNSDKYFDLYIDPKTYLLKANAYNMAYYVLPEPLMPTQYRPTPGPMLRVIDGYVKAGGLTFPSQYITTDMSREKTFGVHFLINASTDKPFDEMRMRRPANAVVVN